MGWFLWLGNKKRKTFFRLVFNRVVSLVAGFTSKCIWGFRESCSISGLQGSVAVRVSNWQKSKLVSPPQCQRGKKPVASICSLWHHLMSTYACPHGRVHMTFLTDKVPLDFPFKIGQMGDTSCVLLRPAGVPRIFSLNIAPSRENELWISPSKACSLLVASIQTATFGGSFIKITHKH